MDSRRRAFLKRTAAFALLAGTGEGILGSRPAWAGTATKEEWAGGGWKNGSQDFRGAFPVLQGWTDEESSQFRILIDTRRSVAYRFVDSRGSELSHVHLDRCAHPSWKAEAIDHIGIHGLRLGEDYELQILDGLSGEVLDRRLFAALDTRDPRASFVLLSCMKDDYRKEQVMMWKAVADANPSVLMFIGDTCYADFDSDGTEAALWRRYAETRKTLDVFRAKRLIPSLATWDDHDTGQNDGDASHPLMPTAREAFRAFFGFSASPGRFEHGPGVASSARLFGKLFLFMDDRSYRSRAGVANGTHWGTEQEEWLFSQISTGAEAAWILNGSQCFGGYLGKESFEADHPDQFKRVLKRFSKLEAPVIFGSGDVHFSEMMKIEPGVLGYETFEFTSSSIHSITFPGHQYRAYNPRRITSTWRHNFLMISSQPVAAGELEIHCRSVGAGSEVLFEERALVKR